jgi:hypothetical protein
MEQTHFWEAQLVKKFPVFYEPESLLSCSKEPATTGPYPESDESNPNPPN